MQPTPPPSNARRTLRSAHLECTPLSQGVRHTEGLPVFRRLAATNPRCSSQRALRAHRVTQAATFVFPCGLNYPSLQLPPPNHGRSELGTCSLFSRLGLGLWAPYKISDSFPRPSLIAREVEAQCSTFLPSTAGLPGT